MDIEAKIQHLLTAPGIAPSEATKLKVLANATQRTFKAYNDGTGSLKDWQSDEKARDEFMAELMAKYPPPSPETDAPAFVLPESGVLSNLNQIRLYLLSQGWKISYDKIKADVGRGVLKPRRGGGFTSAAAERYALTVKGSKPPEEGEDLDAPLGEDIAAGSVAERRILADAKLKEYQGARAAIALEKDKGRLISRDQHEQDLAARLAFFSNQIDVYAAQDAEDTIYSLCGSHEQALRICELVRGDAAAVPELLAWFQRHIPEEIERRLARKQAWLGAFASTKPEERNV